MEDIIMKKIYQAPTIDMVVYHHESPLLANTTPHQGGTIIVDGTEIGTDIGSDGDTGDAKQRNLWDAWDD
jgi:hypothetical protein